MRALLLLPLLVCLAPNATAIDGCQLNAARAAQVLFEKHQDFIFVGAASPPLSPSLERAVMDNLAAQDRTKNAGRIDWNYWSDAQDGDLARSATVKAVVTKQDHARVTLAYEFFIDPTAKPKRKSAVVLLVKSREGCWLVDDVLRGAKSVKSYLSEPPASAGQRK